MSGHPDPRPPKRVKATKEQWQAIRNLAMFRESRCWVCDGPWTQLHHLVARIHGGDDVPANLVPLCRPCHMRVEARDPVARSLIRQGLWPTRTVYLNWKLGGEERAKAWLERNYPLVTEVAA